MGDSAVDISVILPTYNRNAVLRDTLDCVLAQNPQPKEIIVIDQTRDHDAETSAYLASLVDEKRIVYRLQERPNAQSARNWGIRHASCEVLLFLDDDVKMGPGLVGAHWNNYRDPEIAAVAGFFLDPHETPLSELPSECSRPITGWIYLPHCFTRRTVRYSWPSNNGSIRRSVALELGGFDERFTHTLLDDTDLTCRLLNAGKKVVHDPEAALFHRKEPTGGKRPGRANEFIVADANLWYTWFYFFGMNFGWNGWREIASRIRGCIVRKVLLIRPWYLVVAVGHFLRGGVRAGIAISDGRRLGVQSFSEHA